MARKRMLSPEFFVSAPVNRLPFTAMITFAGLWCYFDDFGRGEDEAALIKAAVWPRRRSHTEAKVAADLDLIVAEGLICRYAIGAEDGHGPVTLPSRDTGSGVIHSQEMAKTSSRDHATRLIHSPSWSEHQKISHRTPSKLAPCPIHESEEHAFYLRQRARFPETLPSGARPPPQTLLHGS